MRAVVHDRRHPRRPLVYRPVTTLDIQHLLEWMAAEMRAERAFPWYRAHRPKRFIDRCPPGAN